jgi:autotransporter-associated beta strand protein
VSGTLRLNGPVVLNVDDPEPAVGTLRLVSYAGPKAGGGSFTLGRLPVGAIGTLVDDGAGLVSLDITTVAFPRWQGNVDGNWDTATANWVDPDTTDPMLYQSPLPATFDDNALGTTAVTLNTTVTPGRVSFANESKTYTLGGTGKISGSGGLEKTGAGPLTIAMSNDYTGVTTLAGGVTSVGTLTNGGVAGPLGAASASEANLLLNGGTLEYTGGPVTIDRGLTIGGFASGISNAGNLTLSGVIAATPEGSFNKSGAGSLTLTNPSVTLGGAFQTTEVQAGSLVLAGPGQNVSAPGETFVGSVPGVAGNLLLQNSTLTTGAPITVGRGNGDTGTVSTFTATGSVVQTTGLNTGFDAGLPNDCDQTVTLTNTQWTTNGFTLLAQSGGSTTSVTLAGNTAYTANDRIQMAIAGTAACDFTLQDTASLTHAGGWFSIGNDGTATMTVKNNASVTTANADFNIGDVGTSTGTLNIQDNAAVSATGIVFVGKNAGTTGTVNISGGTFSSATYVTIGRRTGATGHFNISGGTVSQTGAGAGFIVGENGTGTLTVSGTGTLDVNGGGLYLSAEAVGTSDSRAYLNGGTIIAKRVVQRDFNSANYTEFRFNGGVLRAKAGATADFMSGHDLVVIEAGGAFIDSNAQAITISQALGGTGALTKQGTGTLTLSGANTYTGNTTVAAGTLTLNSAFLANTSTVTIASGAVLNLPHGAVDQVNSLILGGVSQPAGTYTSATPGGYITGTGSLQVSGAASPYDTWMAGFPSIPLADRDPGDDPDGDGATNAVEFALGSTPDNGSSRPKIYPLVADSDADGDTTKEMLVTIAVLTGTPAFSGSPSPSATMSGYTYTVEGSTTLGAFTTAAVPVGAVTAGLPAAPAGYVYRTFSLSGSNGTPGKGFLRVTVTP